MRSKESQFDLCRTLETGLSTTAHNSEQLTLNCSGIQIESLRLLNLLGEKVVWGYIFLILGHLQSFLKPRKTYTHIHGNPVFPSFESNHSGAGLSSDWFTYSIHTCR